MDLLSDFILLPLCVSKLRHMSTNKRQMETTNDSFSECELNMKSRGLVKDHFQVYLNLYSRGISEFEQLQQDGNQ